MTSVAIIPARGGSKRIPRKNIRPFLGKPIIAYSIETAMRSRLFGEVMVSTDDEEIAAIARQYGAAIPFLRSPHAASDHAGTVEVLLEVLTEYQTRGLVFEHGCCIYPTAPFVTTNLLHRCWRLMLERGLDSVFPVLRYSYPIQRSLKIEQDRVTMLWPEYYGARSQDFEPVFHDAGQLYCFNVESLREKQRLWTDNTGAVVIPEMRAHDIDSPEDWSVAEFKFRFLQEMGEL